MKKVLVTGCYGFIAGHVIEELYNRGITPIGLARHYGIPGTAEYYPAHVYVADMRDKDAVEKAVSMSDGVINLAGILGTQETIANPYPSVQTNILGALNVLEACRIWHKPLIQIAVGNHWMQNAYSITKTTAERFVQMYVAEHGVRANIVRALNAYGPRQKEKPVRKIVASFITRALAGEPIEIYGDGEQRMDMVYVKDIAHILVDQLLALDGDVPLGQIVEAGTGTAPTVNMIAQTIIHLTDATGGITHLPMRPGEPIHSEVIAKNPVPFAYTPLEKGLTDTVAWYRDRP